MNLKIITQKENTTQYILYWFHLYKILENAIYDRKQIAVVAREKGEKKWEEGIMKREERTFEGDMFIVLIGFLGMYIHQTLSTFIL